MCALIFRCRFCCFALLHVCSFACPSRELREAGEVRRPLLQEGVLALLRLVREVVEQRRVAGELLNARQAISIRVEGRLQEPEGKGAHLEDLTAPSYRLLLELLE